MTKKRVITENMTVEQYREFAETKPKKRQKYNAQKTMYNGITYDSKKEAKRAAELDLLVKSGAIKWLERQVVYEWYAQYSCETACYYSETQRYIADFRFFDASKREWIVEDVKGYKKKGKRKSDAYQTFLRKKKIVEALYNIRITEV